MRGSILNVPDFMCGNFLPLLGFDCESVGAEELLDYSRGQSRERMTLPAWILFWDFYPELWITIDNAGSSSLVVFCVWVGCFEMTCWENRFLTNLGGLLSVPWPLNKLLEATTWSLLDDVFVWYDSSSCSFLDLKDIDRSNYLVLRLFMIGFGQDKVN